MNDFEGINLIPNESEIKLDYEIPCCNQKSLFDENIMEGDIENHDNMVDENLIKESAGLIQNNNLGDNKEASKSVYLRRDVVNKAIIRAFNKFYNKLFKYRFSHTGKSKDFIYNKCVSTIRRILKSSESYKSLFLTIEKAPSKSKQLFAIQFIF